MCQGPIHEFLKALPKCEHHMHLEGSLTTNLLFTLAQRNNITLPVDTDAAFTSPDTLLARYRQFTSLDDFLYYYFIGMSVLQTSSDFEALAYEYFTHAHADGVLHAEVFFDPQAHTSRGVSYSTVVAGITAAQNRAQQDFGISSELIVCILRHLPVADGHRMYADDALPDLQRGIVKGLGLSSTELGNMPYLYKQTFSDAEDRGFKLTAHAGEEGDVSYMASALHDLHVSRIDHGIKLASDSDLMAEFAEKKILITMCPISNVELRCVKSVSDLPIRTYLDSGVKFSINSDDPAYFGGYVLDNFCAVQEHFGLSSKEWEVVCGNAIEGSWCGEERKATLRQRLLDVLDTFGDL